MGIKLLVLPIAVLLTLVSCSREADTASYNLSKSADSFEINRRVIFYNGITGDYILSIEGLCSIGNSDANRQVTITCKTGVNSYKKHFLGLSDNVTYFAEQLEGINISTYHYKVAFRPSTIIPDIEVR